MADADKTVKPVAKCQSCEEFSTMKLTEGNEDTATFCKSHSIPQLGALSPPPKDSAVDPAKFKSSEELKPTAANTTEEPDVDPNGVLCDFCLEKKVAAVKTCLTCMVNYCQMHLKPHLCNAKLQTHQLVDPIDDDDLRTCIVHQKALDRFCQDDSKCVCEDCAAEKHSSHTIISCVDAKKLKEVEVQKMVSEYEWKLTSAENAIIKLEANTTSIQNSVTEARTAINLQFGELQDAVKSAHSKVMDFLDKREKASINQANGIKTYLEQNCSELKKSKAKVESIARRKNESYFLQEYCEFMKATGDHTLPSVYIGLKDKLSSIQKVVAESTVKIIQMLQTSYTERLQEFAKEEELGIKTMVSAIVPPIHRMSAPEPTTREGFLKYKSNVTLDPASAHRFLRLLQDNRKASNSAPWQQPYPDHPERFENFRQVLSEESFYMGRNYFEVEFKGEVIHVGVTYTCIDRKGSESNSTITGNDFSWTLKWNGKEFSAWHSDTEILVKSEKYRRIGVYINYQRGTVAFYGVTETMTLLHQFQGKFVEPLYAAFWLPKKESWVTIISPDEMLLPPPNIVSPVEVKPPPASSEGALSRPSAQTTPAPTSSVQTAPAPTSSVQSAPAPASSVQSAPAPTSSVQSALAPTSSVQTAPAPTSSVQIAPTPTSSVQTAPATTSSVQTAPTTTSSVQTAPAPHSSVQVDSAPHSSVRAAPGPHSSAKEHTNLPKSTLSTAQVTTPSQDSSERKVTEMITTV
uniref:Tripartite motif containing 16 n=1 Tax=Leptobrachium leishanense TaxID=445787 RepID=A0A8C5Q8Y7_9ANUR